ncbi:MAG: hypothetical protein AseanaTS_16160 [Candidatus Pelagadaptatus aseana]|uniref:PQQ-dependent sugar dehydrogenase n=1 Tax=Candidatus Pelagadaptatus aseana TaxID=3120508 RepID=UPI0039B19AFF
MSLISKAFKFLSAGILFLVLAVTALFVFGPVSNPGTILKTVLGQTIDTPTTETIQQRLKVAEGFSLVRYATELGHIRFMATSANGDLLVSQPRQGRVLKLNHDTNGDNRHDGMSVLIDGLTRPHGLALHNGWLYIAESNAVGRVAFDQTSGQLIGDYQHIITGLTDNGNHWTRSLLIHNQSLFLSLGSTCNVCEEEDPRRASIMRFELDGSQGEIFASGLRNSVGLDAAPWNNEIYATDNGRDLLGDDYPPCELNHIQKNQFYGWPYINGFGDLDPDMGEGKEHLLATATSPVFGFAAHNAPLGIRFIRNARIPEHYARTALVALHGSWNRRTPDGYKVIALHWDEQGNISSSDFLSGFEQNGDIIGRPVDIAESVDGCLFVSDDYAGTIYRVCYGQQPGDTLQSPEKLQQASTPQNFPMAQVTLGKKVFDRHNCLQCHHLNDEGNRSGKSLQNLSARYQPDTLAAYLLIPNPPMPRFPLTADEREALAAYLLSQPDL